MLLLIGSFYEKNREDANLGNGLNVVSMPWKLLTRRSNGSGPTD